MHLVLGYAAGEQDRKRQEKKDAQALAHPTTYSKTVREIYFFTSEYEGVLPANAGEAYSGSLESSAGALGLEPASSPTA